MYVSRSNAFPMSSAPLPACFSMMSESAVRVCSAFYQVQGIIHNDETQHDMPCRH